MHQLSLGTVEGGNSICKRLRLFANDHHGRRSHAGSLDTRSTPFHPAF